MRLGGQIIENKTPEDGGQVMENKKRLEFGRGEKRCERRETMGERKENVWQELLMQNK